MIETCLNQVWTKFGPSLDQVWTKFNPSLDQGQTKVRPSFGHHPGMFGIFFEYISIIVSKKDENMFLNIFENSLFSKI